MRAADVGRDEAGGSGHRGRGRSVSRTRGRSHMQSFDPSDWPMPSARHGCLGVGDNDVNGPVGLDRSCWRAQVPNRGLGTVLCGLRCASRSRVSTWSTAAVPPVGSKPTWRLPLVRMQRVRRQFGRRRDSTQAGGMATCAVTATTSHCRSEAAGIGRTRGSAPPRAALRWRHLRQRCLSQVGGARHQRVDALLCMPGKVLQAALSVGGACCGYCCLPRM